jgi:signal transduction histidine kinase
MNQQLQAIQELIEQNKLLSQSEKDALMKAIKDADKQFTIVEFKLDRTEKVKRTTSILLEETIEELEQKRKAVEETNAALQKSMDELKAAQAQLVHAEKMASLGELTAGIAHEIQNPLNFVNNFSEVSADLIQELHEELIKGDMEEVNAIAKDLLQNLEKITHHGKRASFIVNGMLEHSRTSSGEKTATDINVLAEEFLKLSYHGIRAKDKSFNAEFKTNFDVELPLINVVSQDVGRVILNLINNAFYAVDKKAKQGIEGYKPEVIVTTKNNPKHIEIRVEDNGQGIPDSIKDKIFQPFFTTKPTGEGTGLGLSLSYDIITKGHGGELKVETQKGEGSEFIIQLPIKN